MLYSMRLMRITLAKAFRKMQSNRDARRAAFDALRESVQKGRKRPGSMKKKAKRMPGAQK